MKLSHQFWLAATILSAFLPTGLLAQDAVLIREVVSREVSIHVGGVETTPQKEIVSREVSIHIENGSSDLVHEIISREYDVLVDAPGTPPAVNDVIVTVSPTGESVTLDWFASNPWATRDIQRFDIYLSDAAPITDITGLTPYASTGGDTTRLTLDGLIAFTDHYFTIVAVDGLGNRLTSVPYHAAYVLSPELVSREVSLYVGQEPPPPPRPLEVPPIVESGFESPVTGTFVYWSTMTQLGRDALGWSGSGNTNSRGPALFRNGSAWGYAAVPEGSQGISIQRDSSISRTVAFDVAGDYRIAWRAASRGGQVNPYEVRLNGLAISQAFSTSSTAWAAQSVAVSISAPGARTLSFVGLTPGTDVSVGIDHVTVHRVGEAPERPVSFMKEVVSREYDVCVDVPGAPPAIGEVVVSLNAAGDTATLDWSAYNQWAVGDVQRFDIYLSDSGAFSDVTGMTPFASIGGGARGITLSDLTPQTDHYFAVVAVDALGNQIAQVSYSAGYVLMPEVVSREVSLFIGQEPVPPYREVVSREMSIVVSDGSTPAPVTGIGSGFSAVTSVGLFGAIDLDWTSYNELLQKDVSRYRVYLSESYFEDVTGMEPHSYVQTGRQTATIDGFPSAAIRYVAVVAEDAQGNFSTVVRAHSVQASYLPYFRFFDQVERANEGEVADISVELEGFVSIGRYQLAPDTAHAFNGSTGDFVDAPLPLEFKFNPDNGKYEANLQIPIIRDSIDEPEEEFVVLIVNPNEGSSTVVASIRVLVNDADAETRVAVWHPEVQAVPNAPPAADNQLGVVLSPEVSGAQWRLVGEPFWRNPGSLATVDHLEAGIHRVEYKPVAGYELPIYPEDGPEPTIFEFFSPPESDIRTTTYPQALSVRTGTAIVNLFPSSLAGAPAESSRAQWRLVGETSWRNSGSSVPLPVGKHWIEFKDGISGYYAPTPRSVIVEENLLTYVARDYGEARSASYDPVALEYDGAPGSGHVNETPQSFTGQIETSIGYGSGVAVSAHTVLTAASVVFDSDRLAGALDIAWFHQRHADYGEDTQDHRVPSVQYPRGYKLLTSYASMRSEEGSGGAGPAPGNARSDQQDVAVLFFRKDMTYLMQFLTARHGFSGFLADFSPVLRPNPWLAGSLEKKLTGYPMSGIAPEDRGLMHSAGSPTGACESYGGQLYRNMELSGRPGMEGAPLFVKHPNGKSYPAAVYLGENGGAIFRAFDRFVASAIYRAEWEVVATPQTIAGGSGGLYRSQFTDDDTSTGFLYVEFAPDRGNWRLLSLDGSTELTEWLDSGVRLPVIPGLYTVEFQSLEGYTTPNLRIVDTSAGLTSAVASIRYAQTYDSWALPRFSSQDLANPSISSPEARLNGLPNLVAFGFGLEPGASQRPVARPEESLPGLPKVTIDSSTQPPTIHVDFMRRNSTLAPELEYIIEFADSPAGPWIDAMTTPETTSINDEWDHVHLTSAPVAEAGRKFVRVRVERTPP